MVKCILFKKKNYTFLEILQKYIYKVDASNILIGQYKPSHSIIYYCVLLVTHGRGYI